MSARIAVLQFPGLNCESESLRVLEFAGVEADLVRWNEPGERLADYAGFFVPGGFSYQDRVRAGAIAARSGILEALDREAHKGKPVLGICNGAQILVEAGLAPGHATGSESGSESNQVQMCLGRNRVAGREGYHARWVNVRAGSQAPCFFTEGLDEPFPVVVAHAEGRFLTRDPQLQEVLSEPERRTLYYVDEHGKEATSFPDNPNGSPGALAGIAGLDGQVLAFMPHPERCAWLWQVPEDLPGAWGQLRRQALGRPELLRGEGPGLAMIRAFGRV